MLSGLPTIRSFREIFTTDFPALFKAAGKGSQLLPSKEKYQLYTLAGKPAVARRVILSLSGSMVAGELIDSWGVNFTLY